MTAAVAFHRGAHSSLAAVAYLNDYRAQIPWRQIIDQDLSELRANGSLAGTFLDDSPVKTELTWPGNGWCLHCYSKLSRGRRSYCSAECRRAYQREHRRTETADYGAAVARMVRAYGQRAASNDLEALGTLARIAHEADTAMRSAVTVLRAKGFSWADIGRELGITRQAAQQRFATTGTETP